MRRFEFLPSPIAGVNIIKRNQIGDERGWLSRMFCVDELTEAGWTWPIKQINHAKTTSSGTVRGMHYQKAPKSEAKLVSCIRGSVWDVAVDLREGSATYLKWHAEKLTSENLLALLIPPGVAHGFQSLEQDSELLYLHSECYDPKFESGLNPLDPVLSIPWPLEISCISTRDSTHEMIEKRSH